MEKFQPIEKLPAKKTPRTKLFKWTTYTTITIVNSFIDKNQQESREAYGTADKVL